MTASLPSPDVYLSERIILCETKLQSDLDASSNSGIAAATVCDVVKLAARKAVGCAVGDGAVEGEFALGAQDTALLQPIGFMHGITPCLSCLYSRALSGVVARLQAPGCEGALQPMHLPSVSSGQFQGRRCDVGTAAS